jgi:hypothetical protein
MSNILMVPIKLDALYLDKDRSVVEPMADFSRLPYTDGNRDINPDVANLSEEIVSKPFNNQNLILKAGIHLHWALPDALTHGTHSSGSTDYPAVPNRWLVLRSRSTSDGGVREKSWVVESNYIYPEGTTSVAGVTYPYAAGDESGQQPFRLLGRRMPLDAWSATVEPAEYIDRLTAVGYGEPSFAAFYPNCHSVFGFLDQDYVDGIPDGLQYDVVGWYADPGQDFLYSFIEDLTKGGTESRTNQEKADSLEQELKWAVEIDSNEAFPNQMLCYARIVFNPSIDSIENPVVTDPDVKITIGNTGTEALSAYLAQAVDSSQKSTIEDQLESIQLSSRIENHQVDIGPKFKEARHEKGFSSVVSSSSWTIKLDTDDSSSADAEKAQAQAQITLPDDLAFALNELISLQEDYDGAVEEIDSLRKQLFSDWYKYMLSAYPPEDSRDDYPDVDEVKHYIEVKGVAPLNEKVAAAGALVVELDDAGNLTAASAPDSAADSIAARLAQAINSLGAAVEDFNKTKTADGTNPSYRLKQTSGQRYWQAAEPVVLMTGAAVQPTLRHGQDGTLNDEGLLACQLFEDATVAGLIPGDVDRIVNWLDGTGSSADSDLFGFSTWVRQPWNPFLLEWEVEVFPIASRSNLESETGDYFTDFIRSNYTLAENQPELSVQEGKGGITSAANAYTGSCLLTPYASSLLKDQLENYLAETEQYLEDEILDEYYQANGVPESEQTESYFEKNIDDVLGWYLQAYCLDAPTDLCNTITTYQNMSRAYGVLTAPKFYSLSQSLGGFNEALLQHKQTTQLAISDPLGFDDYQSFAEGVSGAVQDAIRSAPEPLTDFNPIRSGAMKIQRLRLIDSFGQIKDLDCGNVLTTEGLDEPTSPYLVALPPRLVQPARLNFRWLSAVADQEEMTDQPDASPICGWVLANNLDNSLMIYTDKGESLGLIDQNANWEPFPGDETPVAVDQIENPHLSRFVSDYVSAKGASFLSLFISAVDAAMENIEPDNFAQHQDLAILMGRPMALVRASLSFELQGPAAIDQSWNAFRQDMRRNTRETRGFTRVEFPIRLGEYKQLNDGLVGYWVEAEGDIFYSPQEVKYESEYIKTYGNCKTEGDSTMLHYQAAETPPQIVSMLVDPRGLVHATAGIVPAKAISIPADQYSPALQAIEMTFLSTPILSEMGKLRLPLPAEDGFKWSWLQKVNGLWIETSTTGVVTMQVFLDAFAKDNPNGEKVWAALLDSQWVIKVNPEEPNSPNTKATVTPKDQRTTSLGEDYDPLLPRIEEILEKSYIGKAETVASFPDQQEIRDGWLKLSRA